MESHAIFVSGHRTDDPGRLTRFPESRVQHVRQHIQRWFGDLDVRQGWILITGGARGADLIAAEEAISRGASVRLMLAAEMEPFIEGSVVTSDPDAYDWVGAFRRVATHEATSVELLPTERAPRDPSGGRIYVAANAWMLAELERYERRHALLVWNGEPGREGGTGQLAAKTRDVVQDPAGRRFRIIDPTPRQYDDRQYLDHQPRRILTLDGGGLRGVITLQLLAAIEQQLREQRQQPDLVLADYFDYIAGTSTGAIIATALALGRPVSEISRRYIDLGHAAFRRSLRSATKAARYGSRPLQEQLHGFFGEGLTLGDPRLRTLLLLVLHRIDTDSPWLLTNCTNAKYNRATRLLSPDGADRNLDLDLLDLIRGSTAAPTYFPAQRMWVGPKRTAVFQDGGVTAFNNPALIAAVMATLPAYGLEWDKGEDKLLVVSVGTGSHANIAAHTNRPFGSFTNLGRLPSVFMNGSAFSQDLLCRVIGDCRYGPKIDNEVEDLVGNQFSPDEESASDLLTAGLPQIGHYFSYVRYDADLTDDGLRKTVVPARAWAAVRKMDKPAQIPNLESIGQHAAGQVEVSSHFRGF